MVVVRKVFGNEYRLTARDSKCVLCTRWRGWGDVMRYKGRGNWYHCRLCSKSVDFYSSFPLYRGLIRHLKKSISFSPSHVSSLSFCLPICLSVCVCLYSSIQSLCLSIYLPNNILISFWSTHLPISLSFIFLLVSPSLLLMCMAPGLIVSAAYLETGPFTPTYKP